MTEARGSERRRRKTQPGAEASRASSGAGEEVRIPRWLPPALYAVLTLWLFRAFVFSNDMLFGSDTLSLGYMARKFYADALRAGAFPKWNPLILGGTPFLESLASGDALYPTSLLLILMEPFRALGWKLVLHIFLAGLFMFGWVRSLGCSRAAALIAGVGYGLAPFLVGFVRPGHDGKIFVISLAPLLFWTAERTFVRRGLLPYVAVSLVIALVILTTHFQMAYFLFGGVGCFYLFRVWQTWRGTGEGTQEPGAVGGRAAGAHLAWFLAAALVGAAVAGAQLVPAVDYVVEFSRRTATTVGAETRDNVEYSSSFSLHPEEVMSYVIPEFPGNGAGGAAWANNTYWGRNGLKDNSEAAGLVVLLLAGLSFFGAPRRGLRLFLFALGGVALLFALGRHTPVWRIFYEVLPGISLFRAPGQASFLFGFALVTLSAFGVDRALAAADGGAGEEAAARGVRYVWIATAVVAALMLLAASGALLSVWTSVIYRGMADFQLEALGRARPFIVRGFFVATLLAASTAAAVWAGRRGFLKPTGVVVLLGLLVAVDALRVDQAFVRTLSQMYGVSFQQWTTPDAGMNYLLQRQREDEPFRVAAIDPPYGGLEQDVTPAMFGLELATGHHPNDLARYRELIGMKGSGAAENFLQGASRPADVGLLHPGPVLSLLNVRYVLLPALLEGIEPVAQTQVGGPPQAIYEVETLPRARLVAEAEIVPDDQAVARILDPSFDPARTAILAEAPPIDLPGGQASGEVTWTERSNNRMALQVRSAGPALLIVADNWFPSWRARVDGSDAPVLRAYHTLRAVPVEAGEHTVEIYYDSPLLRRSRMLSLAALGLLGVVAALSYARSRARGASPAPA